MFLSPLSSEDFFTLFQLCDIIGHWLEMIAFGLQGMFPWCRIHFHFCCKKTLCKRVLVICEKCKYLIGIRLSLQLYVLRISTIMKKTMILWMALLKISPMDSNVIALMMPTMKVVWGILFIFYKWRNEKWKKEWK